MLKYYRLLELVIKDKSTKYSTDKIEVTENEKKLVNFEKNGHMGTTYQYAESVIGKVRKWIEENNYPTKIPYKTSTGKDQNCYVTYSSTQVA